MSREDAKFCPACGHSLRNDDLDVAREALLKKMSVGGAFDCTGSSWKPTPSLIGVWWRRVTEVNDAMCIRI